MTTISTPPTPTPIKVAPSQDILENMINIPVSIPVYQCTAGAWSIVYPPCWTKKTVKVTNE